MAVGVLAAVLAAAAAGCGGGSQPKATTRASAAGPAKCALSPKQRGVIRRAKRMIVRMHRLEQPLKTVHVHGPLKLELLLNRFLLSIGVLPVDDRALLIRKAKSAVGLCRDCFDALEAMEPALQTRLGGSACKPG
ncbi:MAG TPA: hypothetical protein VGK62_04435 [Gaiellaceae bacterium]